MNAADERFLKRIKEDRARRIQFEAVQSAQRAYGAIRVAMEKAVADEVIRLEDEERRERMARRAVERAEDKTWQGHMATLAGGRSEP